MVDSMLLTGDISEDSVCPLNHVLLRKRCIGTLSVSQIVSSCNKIDLRVQGPALNCIKIATYDHIILIIEVATKRAN